MKKYLLILFVLVGGLSACKKDTSADTVFDNAAQLATDDVTINNYLSANKLTAIKDPSGLYYRIVTPGTGAYPTSGSTVTVSYVGKLVDGTQFDSNTAFTASLLSGVITGWRIGVPHINVGGTIELYIPSTMGYGNTATGSIPANSVLIFTITLTSIQ